MARLPTAADINRQSYSVASPRQGIVSYRPSGGEGLQMLGKGISDYADQRITEQDELEAAHVGAQFTMGYANTLNELEESQDYATLPDQYAGKMNTLKDELLSKVNPRVKAKMAAKLESAIAGGYDNVFNKARQKRNAHLVADTSQKGDDLARQAVNASSINDFNAAKLAYNAQTRAVRNAGAIDEAEEYNLNKKWQNDVAQDWFASQPADKQLDLITRVSDKNGVKATSVVDTILRNELAADGKVSVVEDGDGKSIGGINSVAYPSEFAEAKKLLEEKGQEAALKYISDFYRKEIIQKNKIDDLPAGVQDVVADGLTNHWAGFQKDLIKAAKDGATRDELINMRQAEYERLAKENPTKYGQHLEGWMQRLDNIAQTGGDGYARTGDIFDLMDGDTKRRLISGKDSIIQKALDNKMAENPSQFIADLGAGKYNNTLDSAQIEKYRGNAVSLLERQTKQAQDIRIATNAINHKEAYDKIQAAVQNSDSASAFSLVGDLRDNLAQQGQSTQFADDLRAQLLRTNPYSEEEKAQILSDIMGRWEEIKNKAEISSSGELGSKGKTSLEELSRLYEDMMAAKLSGVPGLNSYIKNITPSLQAMVSREQGYDDEGIEYFWQASEPYDKGYQIIQDQLKKSDLENNLTLKSRLFQGFIKQIDRLPKEVLADPIQLDNQMVAIANNVIKREFEKTVPSAGMLTDVPNGAIKSDGSVQKVTSLPTTLKPDAKIDDMKVENFTFPNGVKAKVTLRDGKKVKAQILNSDGSVSREVLFDANGREVR